jgi:hypothetical protein
MYELHLVPLSECPRLKLKPFSTRTHSIRVDRTESSKNVSRVVSGTALCYFGLVVEVDTVFTHGFTQEGTQQGIMSGLQKTYHMTIYLSLSFVIYPVPSVLSHGTVILSLL